MSSRPAPRLAVWLLGQFGLTRGNEPLLGDLSEEFSNGKTVGWYWRQTFGAIWLAIGASRKDFFPLLLGWVVQLAIVVTLVRFRVHLGLYGSLGLVLAWLAVMFGSAALSVILELKESWDVLFKSFLGSAVGNGLMALIHLLAGLSPWPHSPMTVCGFILFNLYMLCVDAMSLVRSRQRA